MKKRRAPTTSIKQNRNDCCPPRCLATDGSFGPVTGNKNENKTMKSIIPLSVITSLAALALVGCNQSSPSNSTETPSSNSRMSDANGTMGGTTNMNMAATNSMANMDMSTNKATSAANDATR